MGIIAAMEMTLAAVYTTGELPANQLIASTKNP